MKRRAIAGLLVAAGLGAPLLAWADDIAALKERVGLLTDRIIAFEQLAAQRQTERDDVDKQMASAIAAKTNGTYPGAPNGWRDFSICADVNNHPGSAIVHLASEHDRIELFESHESTELLRLRDERDRIQKKLVASGAADGDGKILQHVSKIQVTASAKHEDQIAAGYSVTNVSTLKFWNVGNLAPGAGEATMTIQSSYSDGKSETVSCSGTFTGGPSGTIRLTCDGERAVLKLSNGRTVTVVGEDEQLTVDNPSAFDGWPVNFE